MATTTTNFGWDIPQSTDLVKDGATAIAALGQDIDTALVDLKGGTTGQVLAKASGTDLDFSWVAQDDSNAIQNAIVDAKGDLIAATAADTPARLAIGTNGQILTADSTAATGMAWATPASGGGMTLLSTTSLTGASTTISLSGTYKNLQVIIGGVTFASGSNVLRIAPNGSTNLVDMAFTRSVGASASNVGSQNGYIETFSGFLLGDANNAMCLDIFNYQSATRYKPFTFSGGFKQANPDNFSLNAGGVYKSNSAITSLVISGDLANLSTGTVLVYGVN